MALTKPFAKYPHTKWAGQLCYLAGQGCRDPKTDEYAGLELTDDGVVKSYDIELQTRGVLKNIMRALESEGLNTDHLVDVTVFLKTMDDFEGMNTVWNEFFEDRESPTRTTVAVNDLPGHNYVEMKAIAMEMK